LRARDAADITPVIGHHDGGREGITSFQPTAVTMLAPRKKLPNMMAFGLETFLTEQEQAS